MEQKDIEKLVSQMNDARLLNAVENLIYPLIDNQVMQKVHQMCGKFRTGQLDVIPDVASISAYLEIKQHLQSIQTKGERAIVALDVSNKK